MIKAIEVELNRIPEEKNLLIEKKAAKVNTINQLKNEIKKNEEENEEKKKKLEQELQKKLEQELEVAKKKLDDELELLKNGLKVWSLDFN